MNKYLLVYGDNLGTREQVKNVLNELLAQNTGQPLDVIARDVERDFYMTAQEAKNCGIIDAVVEKRG